MAIEVSCRKCGKEYRVREERAGTKIRCKECEATIAVPLSETEEEWPETPMPPARSSRGNADRKSTDRRKKSSEGGSLRIWVGLGVGLVLLVGLAVGLMKFLPGTANRQADGTPAAASSTWVKFTLPDGSASAMFPGPVTSAALPNGVVSHKAVLNENGFAMSDKSPMEMSEDFLDRAAKAPNPISGSADEGAQSLETINGKRCLRKTVTKDGEVKNILVTFIHNRRMYVVAVTRGDQHPLNQADVDSFLKSITFH